MVSAGGQETHLLQWKIWSWNLENLKSVEIFVKSHRLFWLLALWAVFKPGSLDTFLALLLTMHSNVYQIFANGHDCNHDTLISLYPSWNPLKLSYIHLWTMTILASATVPLASLSGARLFAGWYYHLKLVTLNCPFFHEKWSMSVSKNVIILRHRK